MLLYFVKMQVMDISPQQQRYITEHLGHSLNVHDLYYRATSDVIERLDMAKILMLLDNGNIGNYKGRRIENIDMEGIKPYAK